MAAHAGPVPKAALETARSVIQAAMAVAAAGGAVHGDAALGDAMRGMALTEVLVSYQPEEPHWILELCSASLAGFGPDCGGVVHRILAAAGAADVPNAQMTLSVRGEAFAE